MESPGIPGRTSGELLERPTHLLGNYLNADRRDFTEDELKEATLHSSHISPVFGDIAAKMELAAKREVQRLLALGMPIIIDRGNGVEEWCSWPPND
jgi:hypothetical protein